MTKLVPAPLTSAVLFVVWLALARSISAGHVVLALAFAIAIPLLTSNLRTRGRIRRPLVIARFIVMVGYDVIRANLAVAWNVVTWRWRQPRSGFVVIPLELRDPLGLAALAMVTTVVPGTVWSELALDRSTLLLHVWNIDGEEQAFVTAFKDRYEKPLREIFE